MHIIVDVIFLVVLNSERSLNVYLEKQWNLALRNSALSLTSGIIW